MGTHDENLVWQGLAGIICFSGGNDVKIKSPEIILYATIETKTRNKCRHPSNRGRSPTILVTISRSNGDGPDISDNLAGE
jgi:hypothetical protein